MADDGELYAEILGQISEQRIRRHLRNLVGVRHPVAAPEALDRAEAYIRRSLRQLGYRVAEQCFDDGGRRFANLLATRQGTKNPERRVMVLAHFDSVAASPGADDNASGVAVLLEMATVLSRLSCERSVVFAAVNLEENAGEDGRGEGLRGSSALSRWAKDRGWDLEGVLVLESVGYAGETVRQTAPAGLPVELPEKGDFIGLIANAGSRGLLETFAGAIHRHALPLPYFPLLVPGNGEVLPDSRRSDHAPFWDLGYPALLITDTTNFRSPHYHQPSDTLETLNLPFATEVCRATCAAMMELALPVGLTLPM